MKRPRGAPATRRRLSRSPVKISALRFSSTICARRVSTRRSCRSAARRARRRGIGSIGGYWPTRLLATCSTRSRSRTWSAHAIGGRKLAVSASPDTVREYKAERWAKEWNGETFRKAPVLKVLTPMKSPRPSVRVEPLVCFWTALHPEGAEAPLFSVPLAGHPHFQRVSIFSMSSYLRALKVSTICLPMPEVAVRRAWLARLFPAGVGSPTVQP